MTRIILITLLLTLVLPPNTPQPRTICTVRVIRRTTVCMCRSDRPGYSAWRSAPMIACRIWR